MTSIKLHHVKTFGNAITCGHEPRLYSYQPSDVPTREYHVSFDFMIWAMNVPGVDLFCNIVQIGQAVRLSVFKDNEEDYKLGAVYVPLIPPGSTLCIQVELNSRERSLSYTRSLSSKNLKGHKKPSIFSQKKRSKRMLGLVWVFCGNSISSRRGMNTSSGFADLRTRRGIKYILVLMIKVIDKRPKRPVNIR